VIFPDEVLMAYADDELDARTRAAVEAAMASDPEIARRIAQHKALRRRLHSAFNRVLDEPVPARLLRVVRNDPAGPRKGNVVALPRRRAARWGWPQWSAIAASLIVGVIVGRLALISSRASGPILMRGGRVLASGALAAALSDRLAADQSPADAVRIGVSFRSKSGEYCRTFAVAAPAALAGVACRAADAWHVRVLARTQAQGSGSAAYRQAGSSMPPSVIAAVGNLIAGEPLDAHAEAAARRQHWRE
jgi:hypothetical protein